jgi:sulfur carrier protein
MTVYINDKEVLLPEKTASISELLKIQKISENGIAVAVNNTVISKSKWATTHINNNDKIIIITATQGG